MSEEEIINIVEKILSNKEIGLLEATDTFYEAIQCLLDLYNKEKEKRINLEQELETRKWVKVKENGEVEPLFYISKDKMKEKINYYEERGYIEIAGAFKLLLEEN